MHPPTITPSIADPIATDRAAERHHLEHISELQDLQHEIASRDPAPDPREVAAVASEIRGSQNALLRVAERRAARGEPFGTEI